MMMTGNDEIADIISGVYKRLGKCESLVITFLIDIRCVNMHLFYVLIIVLSVVQAFDQYSKSAIWDLFKRIHNKQYIDANEEQQR